MLSLTPLVLQLVAAGVQLLPEIIAAAQVEVQLFNSSSAPTAAQRAAIDAALARANAALQAATAA